MNRFLCTLLLLISYSCLQAQDYAGNKRLVLDSAQAPFYHGVASGDPLKDAVIIWTRITVEDSLLGSFNVQWEIATDTGFTTLVDSGNINTDNSRDYTVKLDVTGLQPYTTYYYRFKHDGSYSITGRTKTAPETMVDQLRFAVVSCSRYQSGYFNVYQAIVNRNDVDAVIHLGDYIYEYGGNSPDRVVEPPGEVVTLDDYRTRYSHYRLDPQLRCIHQQYPFITIWDDHETANNSWTGGAGNHTPGLEGTWSDRKDNGVQAYFEWLPMREPAPGTNQAYRKVSYGELADILVLETRLDGRDEQTTDTAIINDPNRRLISQTQMDWLKQNLSDTTSQWKIIANQVMMAPLVLNGLVLNEDQWDGYPADRQLIYDHILNNNIDDVVVLTGDIHTSWANNLESGTDKVGVEYVTTSVTSGSGSISSIGPFTIKAVMPHVKYVDLLLRGYLLLDVQSKGTTGNFYYVNTVDSIDVTDYFEAAWLNVSGSRTLAEGTETLTGDTIILATTPEFAGNPSGLLILGAYPNPATNSTQIQFYVNQVDNNTSFELFDLQGRSVLKTGPIMVNQGINYTNIGLTSLAQGHYVLVLSNGSQRYKQRIVKRN